MTTTLVLIVAGKDIGHMDVDMYDGTKISGTRLPLPTMLLVNLSVERAQKLSDMIKPKETT